MGSTFTSPYFLAGLLAVIFFFLSAALVGLSLFATASGKRKLLLAENVALLLVFSFLLFLAWQLWQELQLLTASVEPTLTQLGDWMRRGTSVLLLGLSAVFGSLIGCFGWVRAGFAGRGVRNLVVALFSLRVVLASVAVLDLLSRASSNGEQAIAAGDLAAEADTVLQSIASQLQSWGWFCAIALILSLLASFWLGRSEAGSA